MATVALLNQQGNKIEDITLNDSVFSVEENNQVIYDVIYAQRAAMRQGTHKVKNRTEVSGGGRKPWRQKGTGRARQGSIRAPQWRGGGVVFGPTPRSYEVKVNQKVRQLALKIALSDKLRNNKLVVVDSLHFEQPKTKAFISTLNTLNAEGKVLVGVKEFDLNLDASSNNVPYAFVSTGNHISVYDILNADTLVFTLDTVKYFEEVLGNE